MERQISQQRKAREEFYGALEEKILHAKTLSEIGEALVLVDRRFYNRYRYYFRTLSGLIESSSMAVHHSEYAHIAEMLNTRGIPVARVHHLQEDTKRGSNYYIVLKKETMFVKNAFMRFPEFGEYRLAA